VTTTSPELILLPIVNSIYPLFPPSALVGQVREMLATLRVPPDTDSKVTLIGDVVVVPVGASVTAGKATSLDKVKAFPLFVPLYAIPLRVDTPVVPASNVAVEMPPAK
jgi:hypothetical protein